MPHPIDDPLPPRPAGEHNVPPMKGLPDSADLAHKKRVVGREEALTGLLRRLTDLADLGVRALSMMLEQVEEENRRAAERENPGANVPPHRRGATGRF